MNKPKNLHTLTGKPLTIHTLEKRAVHALVSMGKIEASQALFLVRHLMRHVFDLSSTHFVLHKNEPLKSTSDQCALFCTLLKRCARKEPLSRLLGYQDFSNLRFYITPAVLDPRPESELLVQAALDFATQSNLKMPRILDIGTGSGCLILSLLHALPKAHGVGVDCSCDALKVAQKNAHSLGLASRARWILDSFETLRLTQEEPFDIILANPPYVAHNDTLDFATRTYDPPLALFAGPKGIESYQAIARTIPPLCYQNTHIFLEIGYGQEADVLSIMTKGGFIHLCTRKDSSSIARTMIFQRTCMTKE